MRPSRVIRLSGVRVDVGRIGGDVGLRLVSADGDGLLALATPEQARQIAFAVLREAQVAQFYRPGGPLTMVAPDPSPSPETA